MPFVQGLKRRLANEPPTTVFERKLVFDEVETLKQVLPTLRKNTGCKEIKIVVVEDGRKTGRKVGDGEPTAMGGVSSIAENAEPGNPRFEFENISV